MAQLTPLQFANRLKAVLWREPPNHVVLFQQEGALRAIRCSPLFRHHSPAAVLAAAWKAGWLKQSSNPDDFFLDPEALPST
jgi:hypothetical protein